MNAESRPVDGAASHESADGPFCNSKLTGDVDLLAISADSKNPRAETYLAGWAAGWESQQTEIDRLKWQLGMWHFIANNKGKTGADYYVHLSNRLWDEAIV